MAIYPIGIVLIVSARTGRYGFAGVLSACFILGSAPGNPYLARLVDRHGQRRVLVPASVVHAVAVLTLAVLLQAARPRLDAARADGDRGIHLPARGVARPGALVGRPGRQPGTDALRTRWSPRSTR